MRLTASFNYIYAFRLVREVEKGKMISHSTIHRTLIHAESIISHPLNSPRIIRTHRGIKRLGRIVPKICYRSITRWISLFRQWNSRCATRKRSFQDLIVWKIYKIEEIKRAILLLNRDEMLEIFERKNKGNYTFIKMEKKNRKCDSLDCSSQSFLYQVFTRNYFSSPRNDVSIPGENNKLSLSSPLE